MQPTQLPNFVRKTLENVLQQQFDVDLLFNYLHSIINQGSQPRYRQTFERALEKWRTQLNGGTIAKMYIVKCAGTFSPDFQTLTEIRKQRSWEDFARDFHESYNGPSIEMNSQCCYDYQPLNFKDLLKHVFWKKLYEKFGEKIVEYIFQKCAILYQVDEALFVIVLNPKGVLHPKFMKFDGVVRKITNPLKSNNAHTIDYRHYNPYKLMGSIADENVDNTSQKLEIEDRNRMEVDHPIILPEGDSTVIRKKRKELESSEAASAIMEPPTKKQKTEKMTDINNLPSPRWLKANQKDLDRIINHRNSMLKSSSNASSTSSTTSSLDLNMFILNYILIHEDETFPPKDKRMVWKQKATISFANPQLPPGWKGLILPNYEKMSAEQLKNNKSVHLVVYNISETLAKTLNIRLKAKARCRKGKRKKENDTSNTMFDESPNFRNNSIASQSSSTSSHGLRARSKSTTEGNDESGGPQPQLNDMRLEFKPFSAVVKLPITSCLYNKSSWTKWPSDHCITKAVEFANRDDNLKAAKEVSSKILYTAVSCKEAYKHLYDTLIQNWTSLIDESVGLNKVIYEIICAHVRFKDLHKLVKNCLRHWQLKSQEKSEKRRSTVQPKIRKEKEEEVAEKTKQSQLEASSGNIALNKQMHRQPEVIDLTQSTPTTNFSGQSVFEISPEILAQRSQLLNGNVSLQTSVIASLEVPSGNLNKSRDSNGRISIHEPAPEKLELTRKSSGNSAKPRTFRSLNCVIPYNCVMQTLKQVFHIMKLDALLGSKRNIRGFFKFVRKAVILGGTKSSLPLSEAMALIRAEETPFAQVCGGDKMATETFVAKMISWLFNEYLLELLKMSFYITECGFTRTQIKFYLRESWTSASYKMRAKLLKEGALSRARSGGSSPVKCNALLRFVPKMNNSMRSIVIKKSTWGVTELRGMKLLLHYIDAKINKSRMYLPTGIMYEWRHFLDEWKSMGSPKLFFLQLDIRDAYPSVSIHKLKEILTDAVSNIETNFVQKHFALFKPYGKKLYRDSIFNEEFRNNWHSGIHVRPCIVMDLERDKPFPVLNCLENVKKLITSENIVKMGNGSYEFKYGLLQGLSTSPILCSIYYGHFDSLLYRPYLESSGRLFLRLVDDYLILSPSAEEISSLMNFMKTGCEKNKIKLNQEKSETNIYVRSEKAVTACERVTFCGWNICVTCGHISRDYSKYRHQDFCSTITFHIPERVFSPEEFIRLRGTVIVPTRLKPILLDPSINCCLRILKSAFEASILLGYRFYAMCRVLYPSLNALKETERAANLMSSIRLCCSRLAKCVVLQTANNLESEICRNDCCGKPLISSHTTNKSILTDLTTIPQEFRRKCLTYDSLMYVAVIGFRLKLLRHSEPFQTHILPEFNKTVRKLKRKVGKKHCDILIKILGKEIPQEIDQILI